MDDVAETYRRLGGKCLLCRERVSPFAGRVVQHPAFDLVGLVHEVADPNCLRDWTMLDDAGRRAALTRHGVASSDFGQAPDAVLRDALLRFA